METYVPTKDDAPENIKGKSGLSNLRIKKISHDNVHYLLVKVHIFIEGAE